MKFEYFICLLKNVQMRKYLNCDWSTALKITFLFYSGKCLFIFKLKSIAISKRRTVLLPQIFSCPVATYLHSCLSWYQKIELVIVPFPVVKSRSRKDTGSFKDLPALLKTTGYHYCENIFKFTNKVDWTEG